MNMPRKYALYAEYLLLAILASTLAVSCDIYNIDLVSRVRSKSDPFVVSTLTSSLNKNSAGYPCISAGAYVQKNRIRFYNEKSRRATVAVHFTDAVIQSISETVPNGVTAVQSSDLQWIDLSLFDTLLYKIGEGKNISFYLSGTDSDSGQALPDSEIVTLYTADNFNPPTVRGAALYRYLDSSYPGDGSSSYRYLLCFNLVYINAMEDTNQINADADICKLLVYCYPDANDKTRYNLVDYYLTLSPGGVWIDSIEKIQPEEYEYKPCGSAFTAHTGLARYVELKPEDLYASCRTTTVAKIEVRIVDTAGNSSLVTLTP